MFLQKSKCCKVLLSQKSIFWGFGALKEKQHDCTTFIVRKIYVFQTAKCLPRLVITAGKVFLKNSLLLLCVLELQIPRPFVVGTTNTSLNKKDEGSQLAQTSPHPLSSCKCFKFGQTMQRKPTLDTNQALVLEQLRSSQNASTNCALLSFGNSPEFKQCAIEGASSKIAVKRSLRFSPSATSVGLSSLFIRMQAVHC